MSYRPERERAGYLAVYYRDKTAHFVPRSYLDQLETALKNEEPWVEVTNLAGSYLLIRTSYVYGLEDCPAAVIAAEDAEDLERAAWNRTHGES